MFRGGGDLEFCVSACGAHACGRGCRLHVRNVADVVVVIGILVEVVVVVGIKWKIHEWPRSCLRQPM